MPRVVRVLLDTSVMPDWLLDRKPWSDEAESLWQARDTGRLVAYLQASALTDIFYIARRQVGAASALAAIDRSLALEIMPVDKLTLLRARALTGSDFEDTVIIACAEAERLDFIITRNPDDFQRSQISVMTPADFVKLL
ncbi:MAG TPA: PIN domain-containing protein [Ktedonobacterales bacterium]|nr:PIN domain-containing protein [Ktedonobacterales bacterium]